VKLQRPVQTETKFIDIYFTPQTLIPSSAQLGLLSQCVGDRPVAFEPYRNPVDIDDVQACIIKILEVQQELNRESQESTAPKSFMWIVTPTLAQHKLEKFGAVCDEATWGSGVYLIPEGLQTGIIVVHQLPVISETLWFRLMGKNKVQQAAIAEVAALPPEHPYRNNALDLLLSYKIELEAKQNTEPEERELIMQLSPLLLERIEAARQAGLVEEKQMLSERIEAARQAGLVEGKQMLSERIEAARQAGLVEGSIEGEERGELKGCQELVFRLLGKRVGAVPAELEGQIRVLSLMKVEELGDALLDFTQVSDLGEWLQKNR
jgi:Domain of unknown function (DUF4351)